MKDNALFSELYKNDSVHQYIQKGNIFCFRHPEFEDVSIEREIEKAVRIHWYGAFFSGGA